MTKLKEGDTIRIQYTGKLEDGTVFDSSEGSGFLEFTVGAGKIIPGLERGVVDMTQGESRLISVPMEQAYGPYIKERVFELDRNRIPEDFNPTIGQQVQMFRADGAQIIATVIGIFESSFIMDCNHPLAGKNLIFDIKLLEIL